MFTVHELVKMAVQQWRKFQSSWPSSLGR